MRAGDQQRPGFSDVRLFDVGFRDRHVGAVLAQEDQRKRVAVLDAEDHRSGKPARIGAHVRHVAALAGDRFDEKMAKGIVANTRDQARLQPEARATECSIRRRAAQVLGKARHVLESGPNLLGIEVDREAAEADHVQRTAGGKVGRVAHQWLVASVRNTCSGLGAGRTDDGAAREEGILSQAADQSKSGGRVSLIGGP